MSFHAWEKCFKTATKLVNICKTDKFCVPLSKKGCIFAFAQPRMRMKVFATDGTIPEQGAADD
jgi:hypothetical protein